MKKIKYPKYTTLELTISDFANGLDVNTAENITDFDKSVNSYNFEFKDGALTEGFGIENMTVTSTKEEGSAEILPRFYNSQSEGDFKRTAHFKEFNTVTGTRDDMIFFVSGENQLYFTPLITTTPAVGQLEHFELEETPKLKSYNNGTRDCIVFFDDVDGIRSWDNFTNTIHYQNMPLIYDFCEYKNRVFAILSGERLYLRTENTNLLSWQAQAGDDTVTISLDSERGYANKLLTFNGYLFVIRDFGISRIVWYESDKSYNLTHILCSGSRMYADTACVCGDRGLVLCKDGIYEFDGVSAKKLNLKLNRMFKGVSNQNAVATFRNGIYYLACRLNFDDNNVIGSEAETGFKNNALICYDTQTGKYSIVRGVDILDLCTIQYLSADKLYICFNGTNSNKVGQISSDGKLFGNVLPKYWRSPLSDLGFSDKMKYVKEISLLSLYDVKVKVFSEIEEREFDIKGSNVISRVPVRIKGKQIGVSISSNTAKAYVSNFKIVCNLIENEYV